MTHKQRPSDPNADPGVWRTETSPDGAVTTLLLDRPSKLNALTLELLSELVSLVHRVEASDARVLVIRTAGERVFCAGADITAFADLGPRRLHREWLVRGHRAFEALERCLVPTVAVVDGLAVGGGLELALACDLRLVSTRATLGLPEVGLATIPGWGGATRLPRMVGPARARDLILTRRLLSGAEAVEWGIATRLAEPDGLDDELLRLLDELLAGGPDAQTVAKQLIMLAEGDTSPYLAESLGGGLTAATEDFAEGIVANREKRPPRFTGR